MSIEAMKQALEALECLFGIPEHLTGKGGGDVAVWRLGGSYRAQQAIPVLRQAIAEAEKHEVYQEPVAWIDDEGEFQWIKKIDNPEHTAFYIHPQPNVTTSDMKQEHVDKTAKQRHEWVGLTVMEAVELDIATNHPREFAAAIEAKLKQKNT